MNNNSSNRNNRSLYSIAYGFMIVATVLTAWAIIPMSWMIPMTLASKRCMLEADTDKETTHMGLGICCILFTCIFGLVAGILVLVASVKVEK